jgi:hypothetical protein
MTASGLPYSTPGRETQKIVSMQWMFSNGGHGGGPGWYFFLGGGSKLTSANCAGYIPAELYDQTGSVLGSGDANVVQFGGEVQSVSPSPAQTGQMGSGQYPDPDPDSCYGSAAFQYQCQVQQGNAMTAADFAQEPRGGRGIVDDSFYGLTAGWESDDETYQTYFFFGGESASIQ